MRIAKVALAFFSIGFLAGSFERAAGLGHADGGLTQQSRAVQERQVNAAVARGTMIVMASFASFGSGLPEDLFASPLNSVDVPDAVAAALPDLATEPKIDSKLSDRAFVRYAAPQKADDWHLTTLPPLNPDLPRHAFSRRNLSKPDRLPVSRVPSPKWVSVAPAEPFDVAPKPDPAGPNRGTQNAVSQEFIMPFERGRVTSMFHQGRYHPAIDLAGPLGTPVHATTRRQKVTFAGWRGGYGNAVITRDDQGRMHLYGHLQRILARVGSMLDQGQKLGALGSTGHSTGPHVHYEVRTRAGAHVNPVGLLFPGRRIGRGYAWNGARSVTRVAARTDSAQPRPR
jgi:murein DD-endopeptidase MepM/ murein hydrolase activator NlpD